MSKEKPIKKNEKEQYFVEATNWANQTYTDAINAKNTYKKIAWTGAIFGLVGCLSAFTLLPLKTVIPTVIRVDNNTGNYEVDKQSQHMDITDKRNEKIMIRDLISYVQAREGFTRGEAQKIYNIAWIMSCGVERVNVENYFKPGVNKNSPILTMQLEDKDDVKIVNQVFLPSDDDKIKVAQVRYDKTKVRGGMEKERTRYLATITYNYDPTNISSDLTDYSINPFGFCARNYRVDQEGQTVLLSPSNKNNTAANTATTPNPNPIQSTNVGVQQ